MKKKDSILEALSDGKPMPGILGLLGYRSFDKKKLKAAGFKVYE